VLNQLIPPDRLILAADDGDPSLLYYSRRKGWHFPEIAQHGRSPVDAQHLIRELESRRNEGATYLILTQWFNEFPAFHAHLNAQYRRIKETERFLIFDLNAE
jgi:hypothetical protein